MKNVMSLCLHDCTLWDSFALLCIKVSKISDGDKFKGIFSSWSQAFEAWKLQTEVEHASALQEREARHSKEMEELRSFQHNQDSDWLNRCAQIEDRFKADIVALQEELAASQAERLKLEEDYTQKLEKAQAFYENELQALRQNQSSSYEAELGSLREQQERLKHDFAAQEGELRKQIDRLVRQLAETEDAAEAQKGELEKLRLELGNRDSSAESITQMVRLHLLPVACSFSLYT